LLIYFFYFKKKKKKIIFNQFKILTKPKKYDLFYFI
jgi:hypothetical protein